MKDLKLTVKWIPDLPDHRDFKYKSVMAELPKQVDLRDKCSPVKNN